MDELPTIGWREWVELPEIGDGKVKAKIDSGARSSSLHAFAIETVKEQGQTFVKFQVHPAQRSDKHLWDAVAQVVDFREVRSSDGNTSLRPVIVTPVVVCGLSFPIEVTLANRENMGFRMLLGREAVRGRFVIDTGRSYLGGRIQKRTQFRRKKD